jgi:sec-independent protein translocase protein TatB
MFDIGVGEFAVLAVIALLVFGPDRLPQVVSQAAHWLRQLREQAASARSEITESLDLDASGLKDLADLHPKRLAASVLAPVDDIRKQVVEAGDVVKDAVNGTVSPAPPGAPAAPAAPPPSALFDPDAT